MPKKNKPILIIGDNEDEIEQKAASLQRIAEVATPESLQILTAAIDKHGDKINAKLKSYKGLII